MDRSQSEYEHSRHKIEMMGSFSVNKDEIPTYSKYQPITIRLCSVYLISRPRL